MPPRTNKKNPWIRSFVGLSLLIHVHLLLMVAALLSLNPEGCQPPRSEWDRFEVALVPEEAMDLDDPKLLDPDLEKELEKLKEEEKKEKEDEADPKGQVVEIMPPREEKQPKDSRYLSEYDSSVKKETRAPPRPFKKGSVVADRPPAQRETQRPPSPKEQQEVERKVLKLAMRQRPEVPTSELPESETGDAPAKVERQPERPAGPSSPEQQPQASAEKRPTLRDLELSDEELSKVLGSRVNDYLEDVDEGQQTLLNTRRWRFASFFNRVKRRVAENWHPQVVYRRRDPSGNVYGFRDRLTILRVRLTPEGKLREVHLEQASGVGFLDDEAMSAFRAAEPFPNPPSGLVDKDSGLISFRFGFLFEISSRPSFRIFRGN